jgi:hypothetical protein
MVATELASAKSSRLPAVAIIIAGVITGLLTPLFEALIDHFHLFRATGGFSLALGGLPFAALVVAIAYRASHGSWWRPFVLGLVTFVAFEIAITAAANVSFALSGRAESIRNILGGLAGGFVGSALMALAALTTRQGPRRIVAWLPMIGVATILGMLLAIDGYLHSDKLWLLFPVWQASVAAMLTRLLESA